MPVFEFGCYECMQVTEEFRHPRQVEDPPPDCKICEEPTVRLISSFAMPFCGNITARYNDKDKEGAHQEGHWAYALRTPDGKPKPVFLDTFQAQAEFCKQEGLVNPRELPSHAEAVSDRRLSSVGMPGSWV